MIRPRRLALGVLLAVVLALAATGCSDDANGAGGDATTLRLGYFGNVTHAVPLLGVEQGVFAKALGDDVTLETQTFNAGPAAIEAIFAGSLDLAYLGPNPAINAYAKSKGEAIRIIAGASSGGASLVVQADKGIDDPADLKGKRLATPQLGGTQDVALRSWLAGKGLKTSPTGGGDVTIEPTENATTLELFKAGRIDGAWLPEPWASRLVLEGGGKVVIDERDLWPDRKFVTTHLVASTSFLEEHPDVVRRFLEGHVDAVAALAEPSAKAVVNGALEKVSGKKLAPAVLDRAFSNLSITADPIATSLVANADRAVAAQLLTPVSLRGIYDLRLLNEVLAARKLPPVSDAGLGRN